MQALLRPALAAGLVAALCACQKGQDDPAKDKDDGQTDTANRDVADGENPHAAKPPRNAPRQIPPPIDVSQPPADAQKTASGLAYKVLSAGTGADKPGKNDTVQVKYTGWRTTGEMFYTTERRGAPQTMALPQIPQGWSESILDMKVGEKRIVWMPPELATRNKQPRDKSVLVFQIELISIQPAPPVPDDVAAAPGDAKKTASGVAYKVLTPGSGTDRPRPWDQVSLHYTGWSTDGLMFDSTAVRKRPRTMMLFREAKGWSEVVQTMVKGQKVRAWIPAGLTKKRPGLPDGMLVYDFELVDVKKMNDPPPVPKDVAAPPRDAQKTAAGVFYKVLKKGSGTEKPTADKTVKVHYTGWTTDGAMFDSSVVKGKPVQFSLRGVIPGWTDGLQVMSIGDTARFWIPEEMAYKGKPGRPQGMLVFDVELLEIADAPQRPRLPGGHTNLKVPRRPPGQTKGGKPAQQLQLKKQGQ